MTDDSQFFMPADQQARLMDLLAEIPELVEDLAVTLTRQSRTGGGMKLHARKDAQPLPYDMHASEVADDLHNTVAAWVRHVCEYRGIAYAGGSGTAALAVWLRKHVTSLAMTEGCEEAPDEVAYAVARARQAMDRPPEEVPRVDKARVDLALDELVTPLQAEALMARLGHPPLRAATIRQWHKRGKVEQVADGRYRLGDLLDLNPRIQERIGA